MLRGVISPCYQVIYHLSMKLRYIGTHITEEAHGSLRVIAAQEGESVSSLLKRLSLDFIASKSKKSRKQKGGSK